MNDTDELLSIIKRVEEASKHIEYIVSKVVAESCKELDEYVSFVKGIVTDPNQPASSEELDDFIVTLPALLYYAGEAKERQGIKADVAKAVQQEVYNERFNAATGTINDKSAVAELASKQEALVTAVYSRADREIKLKIEAAYELLQSCKKVISRRIAELELGKVDGGRINE